MEHNKKERSSFSGGIGFVLAAAGSAVGLGNLWRFPYLGRAVWRRNFYSGIYHSGTDLRFHIDDYRDCNRTQDKAESGYCI